MQRSEEQDELKDEHIYVTNTLRIKPKCLGRRGLPVLSCADFQKPNSFQVSTVESRLIGVEAVAGDSFLSSIIMKSNEWI